MCHPHHQSSSDAVHIGTISSRVYPHHLWTVTLSLPPGQHFYKYIVDGSWTADKRFYCGTNRTGQPVSGIIVTAHPCCFASNVSRINRIVEIERMSALGIEKNGLLVRKDNKDDDESNQTSRNNINSSIDTDKDNFQSLYQADVLISDFVALISLNTLHSQHTTRTAATSLFLPSTLTKEAQK